MEEEKLPYDLEMAKAFTGIQDEATLKMYMEIMINKVSLILGYDVLFSEKTHFINGVNKLYTYVVARPLKSISQCFYNDIDITNRVKVLDERRVEFDSILCANKEVKLIYAAGYETLPVALQMLLFEQIKASMTALENAGIKSYSIETISYTLADKEKSDTHFINSVKRLING